MERNHVKNNELEMKSSRVVPIFFDPHRLVSIRRKIWLYEVSAVLTISALLAITTTFTPLIQIGFAVVVPPIHTPIMYLNSTYGISIKYPSNWNIEKGVNALDENGRVQEPVDIADVVPPIALDPNAVSYLQLGVENLQSAETKNLDLYLRNAINGYRFNATDFHIDQATTNSQLAGKPAYTLVFSDTYRGFPMKTMVMGTFSDSKFYYVFDTAEASKYVQLLPVVHQMINSFRISERMFDRVKNVTATGNLTS
jgi:hypothetical protein